VLSVRRASLLEGARTATGVAVVIDVFRAFTTAAFCIGAGAKEIVLVKDPEDALAMKRADPSLFLTGEVGGRPIDGFDVGNSPSKIVGMDLTGRRVVQRTSGGTQCVVAAAASAREVVLGSLVIVSATWRYAVSRGDEVTLVASGAPADRPNGISEDEECAAHLEALLLGQPTDAKAMIARIWENEDPNWPEWFPRRDAELASEIDRFDFALPVHREGGLLVARPTIP
jgi:2-phosphosulfolactate phosphatase